MHLLIPFAGVQSEAFRQASKTLVLPHLQTLLQAMAPAPGPVEGPLDSDALSLSPPHEVALARAMGLYGASGQIPWAAVMAQEQGLGANGDTAWGLITPVHWHVGTDQVSLVDPSQLMLDDAASRALFTAVRPLFVELGFQFHYVAHDRWLAAHSSLAELPCASLDRVIGRNVDRWLLSSGSPAAASMGRLQAEVQMLLYAHPVNDARLAQGLLPVNSFWLSGCGTAPEQRVSDVQVDGRLRAPALADDAAAWCKAWQSLDEGPLATMVASVASQQRSAPEVQLTLCGERRYVGLHRLRGNVVQRWMWRLRSPAVQPLLETL